MPPSAKHSSEWLVLHPSSIDEAPQCHPEANLAQVGCAQIPVRRSKVRLSPNRKLSSRSFVFALVFLAGPQVRPSRHFRVRRVTPGHKRRESTAGLVRESYLSRKQISGKRAS